MIQYIWGETMQVLKNKVDIKNNSIYFSDKDNICFLDIDIVCIYYWQVRFG